MSFPKARIRRFNDCESDVPAPGTYDPKFDARIKGLTIEKSDRFSDSKSVTGAECYLSASNKSIGNISATFRTPQFSRKKVAAKSTKPCVNQKPEKLKYDLEEQLAELQVECTNKDKTIQEQERLIEDMKEKAQKLEKQLAELCSKQAEVEDQHKRDIETMAKLQQEVLNDHDEKHQVEIELLQLSLRDTHKELEESNKKHSEVLQKCKEDLNIMKIIYDKEMSRFAQQLEHARQTYLNKIENADAKIIQLSDKVQQLKDKDLSLEEKSDFLETERQNWKTFEKAILEELQDEKARREAAELEVKTLVENIERLKKDYQDISEKYAELVGNHNPLQRIKHVSQLKDKIHQLEQELHAKSRTIEQQRRIIEKQKLEETRMHRKG